MKTCEQCRDDFESLEQYQCKEGHFHSVCSGCLSIITDYAKMAATGGIIMLQPPPVTTTWRGKIAQRLVDLANWIDP